ncbi:SDR family NAD(P)-dependent oxidoreductase [Blastococcus sp. TF02A-30]|uniref:SDR family NAD(P)-dependent oxidoreductase n=1 Tax=Blastococcus sp. TF02A-30 TaxID=2250580 RepID=UPI000DEA9AE6|nr:SDR family oxidoreductase [Blastococcus sp. TF02A-30]RBY84133.1 short-chain dehydrogenase [Blastococcus sp. TF02A-30]
MTTTFDRSAVPDYARLGSLEGRAFLVAGAGAGIGRQTAHALASAGARVLCVDLVPELAAAVAEEVGGVPHVADMTERAGVQGALDAAVEAFGSLAGIVDIIGIARFQYLADTGDEDWAWAQKMNLTHAFLLAQLGAATLARYGGGSIVYIASVSGMGAAQRHAAYGAAKAGMISLVKSAAVEYGGQGVRVNAVAPGVIWTPRIGAAVGEERRAAWSEPTPLGRLGEPRDIAAAALFLASDLSGYVTGQTLLVDGGLQCRFPYPVEQL